MGAATQYAIADLGYKEQPVGSNLTKFGDRFFPGKASPWCAEAVSEWTRLSGSKGPMNASVGFYREQARREGRILPDLTAALAALAAGYDVAIGYEWEHDSWPDHMGLLLGLGVGVGTVHAIEGNAPGPDGVDEVAYHQRSVSLVSFYSRIDPPTLTPVAAPVPPPAITPVYPGRPVLRLFLTWHPNGRPSFTNHGDSVAVLQAFFKRLGGGWDPGPVDGIIGPRTNDIIGRFQVACHIPVDYVVGQQTWSKAFGA